MMRIILSILIFICLILFSIYTFWGNDNSSKQNFEIILVTHRNNNLMGEYIKKAYESVLQEEGVPFKWETHGNLWRQSPKQVLKNNNVLIFPDYLTQRIPYEFSVWVEDFIDLGGNVFIVYNCGTMESNGSYREKAVFTRLLGMNYITYNKYNSLAFQMANLKFKDQEAVDMFEIPPGRYDDNFILTGYQYGNLFYPIAKVDVNYIDNKNVLSYSVFEDGIVSPNTFHKKQGNGNVLFANIPLGYLKAYGSDDLILRSFLKTFLYKIAHVPHLERSPYHKSGLVLNWHIDDGRERKNIYKYSQNYNIIRKNLRQSFDITAGDYVNEPGDKKGFDAAKNPEPIRYLMKMGIIGSHGGWAHNWFVKKQQNNEFSKDDIEYYIKLNNQVLSLITNYKIREYAAPNGIHPQPFLTKFLEQNGFLAYYYPGDLGSEPNRTFFKGKMVSDKVLAFPVMPKQDIVSIYEFDRDKITPAEYGKWLINTLDFAVKNSYIYLIYNHIYDFDEHPQYIDPFVNFLDKVEQYESEEKLKVDTMSYFTEFILRFLKTEYKFILRDKLMVVELNNPQGLDGICVAIPKYLCRKPPGSGFYIEEDENYFYVNITEKVYEKSIICNLH